MHSLSIARQDVFWELEEKYGEIEQMNVCENQGDHLVGNVYVMFKDELDAEKAVKDLNNRWFGERPISAELSPVTDFREACCRQYEQSECTRGGFCNFMHIKPVSKDTSNRIDGGLLAPAWLLVPQPGPPATFNRSLAHPSSFFFSQDAPADEAEAQLALAVVAVVVVVGTAVAAVVTAVAVAVAAGTVEDTAAAAAAEAVDTVAAVATTTATVIGVAVTEVGAGAVEVDTTIATAVVDNATGELLLTFTFAHTN
jgi:hypothetical protein